MRSRAEIVNDNRAAQHDYEVARNKIAARHRACIIALQREGGEQ